MHNHKIVHPKILLAGAVGIALSIAVYAPWRAADTDWVETARSAELQPCLSHRKFMINVALQDQDLPNPEKSIAAGVDAERVIPEGHWAGFAVPTDCFAVYTDTMGYRLALFERPWVSNTERDHTIPYFTTAKGGLQ